MPPTSPRRPTRSRRCRTGPVWWPPAVHPLRPPQRRAAGLVHHLMHHVHEVRCEPGLIEFRPEPQAPADLAPRLADLLGRWTGRRWIATVSRAVGKPTLAAQKVANADSLRAAAESNPVVQAILKTFPGAKLETVRRKGEEASLVAGLGPG